MCADHGKAFERHLRIIRTVSLESLTSYRVRAPFRYPVLTPQNRETDCIDEYPNSRMIAWWSFGHYRQTLTSTATRGKLRRSEVNSTRSHGERQNPIKRATQSKCPRISCVGMLWDYSAIARMKQIIRVRLDYSILPDCH